MFALPPGVRQELVAGLRARQRHVARALMSTNGDEAEPVAPGFPVEASGNDPLRGDPEECLRRLMVQLLPRFMRGECDAPIVHDALRLLSCIAEAAKSEDLRYFDAFNSFWEHWPSSEQGPSAKRFQSAYASLIAHHLGRWNP